MLNADSIHIKISQTLYSAWIDTKLGPMLAIADEKALYLLEFDGRRGLEQEIERLKLKQKANIIKGVSAPITCITHELKDYFEGHLKHFKTPVYLSGSPFQKAVWQELTHTPYGTTRNYKEQAQAMGQPKAYRAVANANGANPLALMIPCHRIMRDNGQLGGYGGGLSRKKWLIDFEKSNKD